MPTPQELQDKFWQALKDDRTVMLGLDHGGAGHTHDHGGPHMRPMTACTEHDESGPIWFFTAKDTALVRALPAGTENAAHLTLTSKGHDLFACVHGSLRVDTDRAVIDRLWNNHIAAWYEGGKDDPKLALLRFDPAGAEIWLNEFSLMAGIKMMFGADPKKEYDGKVAEVRLS